MWISLDVSRSASLALQMPSVDSTSFWWWTVWCLYSWQWREVWWNRFERERYTQILAAKPGARNSVQVSHLGAETPTTGTMACCLPGCTCFESWNWQQSRDFSWHLRVGCGHPGSVASQLFYMSISAAPFLGDTQLLFDSGSTLMCFLCDLIDAKLHLLMNIYIRQIFFDDLWLSRMLRWEVRWQTLHLQFIFPVAQSCGQSLREFLPTGLQKPIYLSLRHCLLECTSGEAGDRSLSQVSNPNILMWNVGHLTHRNWHPNPGVNVDSLICFKMILSGYLEGKYLF